MGVLLEDAPSDLACGRGVVSPYARSSRPSALDQRAAPLGRRQTARSRTNVLYFKVRSFCLFSQISIRDIVTVNPTTQGRVPLGVELNNSAKGVCNTTARQPIVGGRELNWLRSPWLRQAVRTVLAAAAFIALVVMALGGPANKHGVAAALGIRWAAALLFALASLALLRIGRLPKEPPGQDETIGPPVSATPSLAEIWNSRQQISLKYRPEVLDLFSRILSTSSQYLTRAIEIVEVRDSCLCLDATMEYAFNDALTEKLRSEGTTVILLPLIKLSKGATLDNLDLTDCEDRHAAPLLQDEIYGLLAHVIDSLFRIAYIHGSPAGPSRDLTPLEEAVLVGLIHGVCNPIKVKHQAVESTLQLLNLVASSTSGPIDGNAAASLRNLFEFFADNYLIAVEAELPQGTRLTMKYSRTVPLYEQAAKRADRSRVRLGLSPQSFSVPLTLPFEAPSYHFSMAGVPGSFAARQTLFEIPSRVPIRQDSFKKGKIQPFLSAKCDAAPYTHFHTRGLHRFPGMNMWTRVEFDEVPPGALAGATVVSVASAVLIWFFTLVQPGLTTTLQVSTATSDLPALLLTVPAFAATWIGASADRVQRSSICTYIGLCVSTVVSLGSALLYIANANHKSFFTIGNFTFDHGLIHLKHVDATWLLLALIASVMSAYLVEILRDKVRNYMKLLAHNAYQAPD